MFSSLLVALFAVLSLPHVAPAPVQDTPCDLANATATPSIASPLPTVTPYTSPTDDCSESTPFTVASTSAPPTDDCSEPTPSSTPVSTTAATDDCSDPTTSPTSTPASSTPASSTPAPTTTAPVASTPATSPTTSSTPTTSATSFTPAPTSATSSAPAATSSTLATVVDASNGPFTGGVATYYYQNGNAGACGQVNSDYAYICAMDQTRFGTSGPSSPLCGKQVQITNTNTGGTITVTIADDCPTCDNENSIDLSVGAFEALAQLSEGVFPISWSYV